MITKVKIHPAIGIARVGNSPDRFFIGPEKPGDKSIPDGGYKDNQCRIKRQIARFRIFAYNDDGSPKELTSEDADITWSVHLANKKATVNNRNPGSNSADLTIDPGLRLLTMPNQLEDLNNGTIKFPDSPRVVVPLGQVRTDKESRLLILGGFGKSETLTDPPVKIIEFYNNRGWYDDVSDGPIKASVKIRDTGETIIAEGAWVIIAPPKFAPGIDNIITLYDTLYDLGITLGWFSSPSTPSYTHDIYPILNRAQNMRWVINVSGAHMMNWIHPIVNDDLRNRIFSRIRPPTGGGPFQTMPRLAGDARLTKTQYQIMKSWKDGNFKNDWTGPPSLSSEVTPEGLDQAALENAVGAAFFPGIEAGGITINNIIKSSNYVGPFRLNHNLLGPGDITAYMAIPWQADFLDCDNGWWPVPRPNEIIPQGTSNYSDWDRGIDTAGIDNSTRYDNMVKKWHTLGFVIKQGDQYVEVDRCDTTFTTILTPIINFKNVPQVSSNVSNRVSLPIVFEVKSTNKPVSLEVSSDPIHPRLTFQNRSVNISPTIENEIAEPKLWITYETGDIGESINDKVIIKDPGTGQTWKIIINANTVKPIEN